MSFNTEGMTSLCCIKLKESVTIMIFLCLATKGLSRKNKKKVDNYNLRQEIKKI